MNRDRTDELTVTASDALEHVAELRAERALAELCGMTGIESYMRDLEQELEVWREVYVVSAVTEIATLRAELFGPQVG